MVGSVHGPSDDPLDSGDVLVPLSTVEEALDGGLEAVRERAEDGESDYYEAGLLDGAEQVHRHARRHLLEHTQL